ncbi:UvrD-helicase domain-containing protein [Granulicoccus sp. GXG6511]|uniref:UvrD-helicase domain-containing protein n=1 Tax=Granulicoccus sp. GXG6511 TaxID=3381351 RepID=UPI003D7C6264
MTARPAHGTIAPTPFDVTGPLPGVGTHVLEASAGTGKTYAIAALATRYLAEGVPLPQLMMVTFSRAATQELRDRIRARLTDTEFALLRALDGADPGSDQVDQLLCRGSADELRIRLQRIATALADFDAATISTTHEFCGRMLDGLGVLAGTDPGAVLVEDLSDLAREVAADFWLRAFAEVDRPDFRWREAEEIALRVARFDGPFAPDPATLPTYARQFGFATAVRREIQRRKTVRGLITHDDLLTRLRDLLRGKVSPDAEPDRTLAEAVRTRLRNRFRVVLVDEFQDTDPVQWEILERTFAGHSTMVLIGDPKQAIYGFRGAEVNAYLAAVGSPGAHLHTLSTNWRTDAGLVEAVGALFGQAQLGDERIVVREVSAHHDDRFTVADEDLAAPLRLKVLPPSPDSDSKGPTLTELRNRVHDDLVADIGRLLAPEADARVDLGEGPRRITPRDVAVLVRGKHTADSIRDRLTAAGIPAVHTGATSVFDTPQAQDWLTLLRACEAPRSETIRATALTSFVGWSLVDLATAGDQELADLSGRIRGWARTLSRHGLAALSEAVLESGLAERLLERVGGDRELTDLRHLGELLHAAQVRERFGTTALAEWLDERIREGRAASDDRTRRMESDADAVQIMTFHRAKGLEFPVVYLPDRWETRRTMDDGAPFEFHHGGIRHLYLAGRGRDRNAARKLHDAEEAGEELRLLYVAATRAQCRLVLWWAAHEKRTPAAPLHRMLFRAGDPAPRPAYPCRTSPADLLHAPGISVQQVGTIPAGAPPGLADPVPELRARSFTRTVDRDWRRTSYSNLTARVHELSHSATEQPSETVEHDELQLLTDEAEPQATTPLPAPTGELARPSPMTDLPRGAAFGTLVHAIYETFDPHADDLDAEIRDHAGRWLSRLPVESPGNDLTAETLAEALLPAIRTPLGPLAGGLRLCDIPGRDRLAELDFEYALAGGERPSRRVLLGELSGLLARHLTPDDPLAAYPARLADPLLTDEVLRGFLVGSIDAVLRVPDAPGQQRYLIVDYKTNWLGPLEGGEGLVLGHYVPSAMADAMMTAHYPLQALLYAVALHRFLRWRLPDYDPDRHLGGVVYLFVRGMAGPDTPVVDGMPCGVFAWRPSAALITELSDLLAGLDMDAALTDTAAGDQEER